MKRLGLSLILLAFLLVSCSPEYGVYQGYTWTDVPNLFSDSNPYTPTPVIYRDEYFKVLPGNYEMIYRIPTNGITWYVQYTIYEDDSYIKKSNYFMIGLYDSGPSISHHTAKGIKSLGSAPVAGSAHAVLVSPEVIEGKTRIPVGTETKTLLGITVSMEYGRIE